MSYAKVKFQDGIERFVKVNIIGNVPTGIEWVLVNYSDRITKYPYVLGVNDWVSVDDIFTEMEVIALMADGEIDLGDEK